MNDDWTEFPEQPTESGDYLVAHRGHMEVIKFLAPTGEFMSHSKRMWQKDPRKFGGTHWRKVEGPPDEKNHIRQALGDLPRGAVVVFRYDREIMLKYGDPERRVKKKWSWKSFGYVAEYDYWEWPKRKHVFKAGDKGIVIKAKRCKGHRQWGYWVQIGSGENAGWCLFQDDDIPFDPVDDRMFALPRIGMTRSDDLGMTLIEMPYD